MVSQLDDILTRLGTGKWSVLHIFVMGYTSIFLPPYILGGAFLAPRLDYSCRVPRNSISAPFNFTTFLQENGSISFTSKTNCEYRIETEDRERIEECVEFDFDNSTFSSTFTSEYQLACGRSYLQASFQSIYMTGFFVGAPVNGYLSDKYGRKPMVTIGYISFMLLGLASAWFPSLSTILAARFFLGFLHPIGSFSSYIHMLEILEPKRRTLAAFGAYNVWAVAVILYGGLGYLIRDWRILQTVATLPGLLILPGLWMIDESPRWLVVNGRSQEALRVFKKAARWHGVDLPPDADMKKLLEIGEVQDKCKDSSVWVHLRSFIYDVTVLFRTPSLRKLTLCLFLNFLIGAMVYYGLSLSGANISNDPYLYMALSGLMELPAYTFTSYIVQYFGRKPTICVLFLFTAIVLLALAVTPEEYSTIVITLAMVGKIGATASFQAVIFFSSELFPTEVRSRGVCTSFMFSRIGGMVAPYINDLAGAVYRWAPFVVFGSGSLLAAAGTLLLQETRGQSLPDTLAHT